MSMLDRRLQVLIDEDRWRRLERAAKRRKVSVGTIVREAIDEQYPGDVDARRAALQAVLDAGPMEVPDIEDLHRELEDIRGRPFA